MTTELTDEEIDDALDKLENALTRDKEALAVYEEEIKGREAGKTRPASETPDTTEE